MTIWCYVGVGVFVVLLIVGAVIDWLCRDGARREAMNKGYRDGCKRGRDDAQCVALIAGVADLHGDEFRFKTKAEIAREYIAEAERRERQVTSNR